MGREDGMNEWTDGWHGWHGMECITSSKNKSIAIDANGCLKGLCQYICRSFCNNFSRHLMLPTKLDDWFVYDYFI